MTHPVVQIQTVTRLWNCLLAARPERQAPLDPAEVASLLAVAALSAPGLRLSVVGLAALAEQMRDGPSDT